MVQAIQEASGGAMATNPICPSSTPMLHQSRANGSSALDGGQPVDLNRAAGQSTAALQPPTLDIGTTGKSPECGGLLAVLHGTSGTISWQCAG
jgi:hypothetical protein